MPDRLSDRRTSIQHDLDQAIIAYAETWQRVTEEWQESSNGNHAWLTYSANYLVSCAGYKWALDPFAMSSRVPGVCAPDYQAGLAGLSVVLLSHAHNDHLDRNLITAIADTDVQWIIPHYVKEKLQEDLKLPAERVFTPIPGEMMQFGPLRLLPFESLHMRGAHGVPETGYLVEFSGKRWLFPGDIRDYDYARLPDFGRLDGVFAHLWLGKAGAMEESPTLLTDFCDFFNGFQTDRLIISHINEFGRDEKDLWRPQHFELVKIEMTRGNPHQRVEQALMGDCVDLY
jgi:hypothetical protein